MPRPISEILQDIRNFNVVDGNWLVLEDLLEQLWKTKEPERGIEEAFGVLERYPEEDAAGVFWSIIHGVESLPNYENKLVDSIQRKPSYIALVMINRIINTGTYRIGEKSIAEIIEYILNNTRTAPRVRREAEKLNEKLKT